MPDTVKMWHGEFVVHVGYPMVIVTTQEPTGNEFPGEWFLWVQEMPGLKIRRLHQLITALDNDDAVAAGFRFSQGEVEEDALAIAQGHLQHWQYEAWKEHQYDPTLKKPELAPVDDWQKALLRLRAGGRLPDELLRATAHHTISDTFRSFLDRLLRIKPITVREPQPYDDQ